MSVNFKILTLFKEAFYSYLNSSIIKRGIDNKNINIDLINFRDYSNNKHKKVDDTPYGGGPGMLLSVQPLYDAIRDVKNEKDILIFFTPNGQLLNQKKVIDFANKYDSFILVCGKYEGFDARIFKFFEHQKISIGDYILTGGELPALVFMDAISRYKDILHNENSVKEESFSNGLLEYDQYTRPRNFENEEVPEVLFQGHHSKIEAFKEESSIVNTLKNRPELIEKNINNFSNGKLKLIENLKNKNNN